MTTDQTTPYPLRDLTPPELPSRSRLYYLEPIGVGTAQVESLTSYLSRLARAHSVSSRRLAMAEMATLLDHHYPGEVTTSTFSEINHAINGTARSAIRAVLALEKLTMRNDLRFLTMWNWHNVISDNKLLRSARAWCPVCYDAWRQAGQILYEPLLWALTAVTVCPHHHQHLHQQCPHQDCQATLPVLTLKGQNGYCTRCQGWLGVVETEKEVAEQISSEEMWQANLAGELLASAPFLTVPPAKDSIVRMISTAVERTATGSVSALARQLGVPVSRLQGFVKTTGTSQLGLLLDTCYRLAISPLDFLTGPKMPAAPSQMGSQKAGDSHTLLEEGLNRLDLEQMEYVLTAILASDEIPPPSLSDAARQLEQVEPNLHRHFPELCRAIIDRRRQYYEAERLRIQHQLGAILAGDEALTFTLPEVAQRLECSLGLLRSRFPEACHKIVTRRQAYQEAEKLRIREAMETIVAREESPPPLLREVAQRLEQPPATLRAYCPELYRIIVERHQRYHAAEKLRIQHELEAILANEEPPPSLNRVIERFDLTTPTFYHNYPELCQAITVRYQRYKAAEKLKLQGRLETILTNDESPPPSMAEVARRLEQPQNTLYSGFPELCQAIVVRGQRYHAAEKLRMQQALEAVLTGDEAPPSVTEVARQFACDSTKLWRSFPKLCQMILERRQQHQATRKSRTQHELEAILARHEEPPPSVAEVAQRLAYDSTTIRRHFPEACQLIVKRRQAYLAAKKLRAQHALEAALAGDEEPPLSVVGVARQLEYDPTTLGRQFPELCQVIVERRRQYKAAELLKVQNQLEAVLANDEIPPPSLSEVTRRLEPRSRTLWTFFPELCQAIIERRQKYQEAEKLRIQHELEAILANDEKPPPSLEEVSRRVVHNGTALRHNFPELCRAIVERYHDYQTVEKLRIQHELEAILTRDEDPPPSLEKVAQQLGCSSTRICTLCPELARNISTKYLAYQKDLRAQTTKQLCAEVRQATFQVYQEGLYPSQYQVALRLAKSKRLFFNPEIKAAWREALHELGLSE